MLPSVGFDDQPPRRACEVHDVAVDWKLPLELVAGETLRSQNLPKPVFGGSWLRTHLLCALPKDFLTPPLPAAATRRLSLPRGGGGACVGAVASYAAPPSSRGRAW